MVVTLCGSSRFEHLFKAWNLALTVAGHAVFTLTSFPSSEEEKRAMDLAYRAKISASNAVVVLNFGGYLGTSALEEIGYAISRGKQVYFLDSWGKGCGLDGIRSPISTVDFPSVWDSALLGPASATRSRSVDRLEAAKTADRPRLCDATIRKIEAPAVSGAGAGAGTGSEPQTTDLGASTRRQPRGEIPYQPRTNR